MLILFTNKTVPAKLVSKVKNEHSLSLQNIARFSPVITANYLVYFHQQQVHCVFSLSHYL